MDGVRVKLQVRPELQGEGEGGGARPCGSPKPQEACSPALSLGQFPVGPRGNGFCALVCSEVPRKSSFQSP